MIRYRPFLNTDPPELVRLWQCQTPLRGRLPEISLSLLEHSLLSKPYFEAEGLWVAEEESEGGSRLIGFVHAGFGPNHDHSDLDWETGVVSMLQLDPDRSEPEVADTLMERALDYLRQRGAKEAQGGSWFPFCPFYLGLYGGSEIPGVLQHDLVFRDALVRSQFETVDRVCVMQRQLAGFRPASGRGQLQIRRQYQINAVADPLEQNWWECCTLGMAARERFSIFHKQEQTVCGSVSFWDMQPLAGTVGLQARGMNGLNVPRECRRSGIATFLVGESLKFLLQQGIEVVEAQIQESETAALGVFHKLGFEMIDQGLILSRSL